MNQEPSPGSALPQRLMMLVWTVLLTANAFVAAAWWWLSPGGFPLDSARFWVNRVIPILLIVLCLVGRLSLRKKPAVSAALLAVVIAAWASAAVASRIIFPVSFQFRFLGPLSVAAILAIMWLLSFRQKPLLSGILGAAAGIVLGALLPMTQRGADPATLPTSESLVMRGSSIETRSGTIRLSELCSVDPHSGVTQVFRDRIMIAIEPMLTFDSLSPDRCWTLFAPPSLRRGAPRQLQHLHLADRAIFADYTDLAQSQLDVSEHDGVVAISAKTQLDREIYSHLNTYCTLLMTGHRKPGIAFSSNIQRVFEVTHNDYPFGQPLQFAYLSHDEQFHIVRARSAEKGPFTKLDSGDLPRGEPLTITLLDQGRPVVEIELLDWSSQASLQRSPTAGWGVPENAIEFSRSSEDPRSAVSIFITLASTSVGRGYESVGHAAGTYVNRMRIRMIPPE